MKTWIFGSKLEEYPNPDYLGIHTRAPLTKNLKAYYFDYDKDPESKGFTTLTTALIRAIEQIPGITGVSCKRHCLSIQRSPVYTWEELLEAIRPFFVSYVSVDY